ncbi:hypothetical protein GOBAR_AA25266 [Gossypium barbadense]|uniref:Piwi domain-containing protein n=1 Tax=Gossypium barbadense TaxID=3634 RepID=A0A2P5WWE1_GOSBA|nr:hypothetical protein GOBAR_AA25266 [Gossypium barbadense]
MLTLGQTPSIPVVSKVPTIILGMGALFGFPEQSDVPSIAAMILSSKPVSDKVDDGIMKEALLDFYTSSEKKKPDQIIIFREKVSESQFNQVLIKLLRLASSLARSGTLKIMVIIVRKTIIPSFFFQQGSLDNVLHGIVIDNKVCHPKNNASYLGTHAGMIGIMRQTHYYVLLDQARFWLMICKSLFILYPICIKGALQPYLLCLLFATLIWQLHSWGKFMKIRDASEHHRVMVGCMLQE